ncbi:MAG TPA: S-formylglutathione hydrolase [Povalibacter sp.]|uniref:S-formylglutathione hydrolase n=1 Tax=Povalibacter sp. TaxID=1962978 RepID=UPI002C8A9326|nr:S-formylglutathione hydrolase [Povalibacter sp.]HMN46467.1 S-formylglutathione hydrolase [Povalibacter sp.]
MLKTVSSWRCFGGRLDVFDHESSVCRTTMRFAVFSPPQTGKVPVLWYLSGLTCTWENVMTKAGLQRTAAELGIMIIAPDTSPRGEGVPDDTAYDLGQGAGFYLSATQAPWSTHFHMDRYVVEELQQVVADNFAHADLNRQGITGHSMGGHGALMLHLKHPQLYRSVSAFAPIVAPTQVPWGQKAFTAYLGNDRDAWRPYDACELVKQRPSQAHVLIDQGSADTFLQRELQPERFVAAAKSAGQQVTLRLQEGYDHSYYFIATFIDDHLRWHAQALA